MISLLLSLLSDPRIGTTIVSFVSNTRSSSLLPLVVWGINCIVNRKAHCDSFHKNSSTEPGIAMGAAAISGAFRGSCLGGSRRKIYYVDPWYWLYVAGFWRTCQFWLHHFELRPLILYMNRIPMKQAVDRCNFRQNTY